MDEGEYCYLFVKKNRPMGWGAEIQALTFFFPPLSGIWFLGSKVRQALSIRVGAPTMWQIHPYTVYILFAKKNWDQLVEGGPSYKYFGGGQDTSIETMQIWTKMGGAVFHPPPQPIDLIFFLQRDNYIGLHQPKGGGTNPSSFCFISSVHLLALDSNPGQFSQ